MTKRSVVFLDITYPQFLAVEVESFDDPSAGHHEDARAVGHRGRRRHILLAHLDVAAAKRPFPNNITFRAINAPEIKIVAIGHIQENAIAPDNRCGSTPAWHSKLPGNGFFRRPPCWQISFIAKAMQVGTTPLRPILRIGNRGQEY